MTPKSRLVAWQVCNLPSNTRFPGSPASTNLRRVAKALAAKRASGTDTYLYDRSDRWTFSRKAERFDVPHRGLVRPLIFPDGGVTEMLVVAFRFPFAGLVFLAGNASAARIPRGVSASRHNSSPNSRKSATRPARSRSCYSTQSMSPTTLTFFQCPRGERRSSEWPDSSPALVARHAAQLPHDVPQFAVNRRWRALALDVQHALDSAADFAFDLGLERRVVHDPLSRPCTLLLTR